MEEDLDEFGEYIGDEYSDSGPSENGSEWESADAGASEDDSMEEQKQYDTEDISVPLVKRQSIVHQRTVIPDLWDFQYGLMQSSRTLLRSFAIVGYINHGKTALTEWLLEKCISQPPPSLRTPTQAESQRCLTLYPSYYSFLLNDSRGKSYVFNLADTPGHPDFCEEAYGSLRICDSTLHVVDIIEGPILECRNEKREIIILNKLDRLILDQRLPPSHAFRRIKTVAGQLNRDLSEIVFMSTKFKFAFTLKTFNDLYVRFQDGNERGHDASGGDFDLSNEANFTKFILAPIYKLFSCGLVGKETQSSLGSYGIHLSVEEWELHYDERITLLFERFFEDGLACLIDKITSELPFPSLDHGLDRSTLAGSFYDRGQIFSLMKAEAASSDSVSEAWIPYGNEMIPVSALPPGSWFYTRQNPMLDTRELGPGINRDSSISIMKVEVVPKELTNANFRMLETGLAIAKFVFPSFHYMNENDAYHLYASGELYLDTCLEFLRNLEYKFRVGTPSVELKETVSAVSYAVFPTRVNAPSEGSITAVASPYTETAAASQNVWCHLAGQSCILIGPQAATQFDESLVSAVIEGFDWFVKRGPLVEGAIHQVCIEITQIENIRPGPQITSAVHRSCCAALLMASPKLMEPIAKVVAVGRLDTGRACYSELAKRGGEVVRDEPILGTNLYRTEGAVPLIDSFGLQVDIACQLESRDYGQIICIFDSWKEVSGDPLDSSLRAPRLKPASPDARARDFLLKTRKSKGLSAVPQLDLYVDEDVRKLIN